MNIIKEVLLNVDKKHGSQVMKDAISSTLAKYQFFDKEKNFRDEIVYKGCKKILIVHLTHSRPPPPWLGRGWWQGAASSRAPAWPWMAAAPVKAPESLAESQMRQLDNQEED